MATHGNCQYDMVQHHSTNQSVNAYPKVVEIFLSRPRKALSNICFREPTFNWAALITVDPPPHHHIQERLESHLAKS